MHSRLRRLPPVFFIGLFPVVILLWAWADSTNTRSTWTCLQASGGTKSLILEHSAVTFEQSHVDLSFLTPYRSATSFSMRGSSSSHRFERGQVDSIFTISPSLFPAPDVNEGDLNFTSPHRISTHISRRIIPLWLILLAWLPPWLALSWWQARRRRAKITAALPLESPAA